MARFPSDRFRRTVIAGGEVRAVVELVKDGVVVASSETGDIVIEDGTYTFDLTRSINADLSLTLLIPDN
jgi:hypothetical protein